MAFAISLYNIITYLCICFSIISHLIATNIHIANSAVILSFATTFGNTLLQQIPTIDLNKS